MKRALVAAAAAALLLPAPAHAQPRRQALLLLVEPMTYEEALRDPVMSGLARSGGLGLLTTPFDEGMEREPLSVLGTGGAAAGSLGRALDEAGLVLGHAAEGSRVAPGQVAAGERFLGPNVVTGARDVLPDSDLFVLGCCQDTNDLQALVQASPAEDVLVVAIPARPTEEALERGDDVVPVALARGAPSELFPGCSTIVDPGGGLIEALPGCLPGLTSDTTRRAGIVSSVDVAPTLLDFFGLPIPEAMSGTPMRVEDAAPTRVHERYLEYRQVHTALGLLQLALALLGLAAGLMLLFFRRRATQSVVRAVAWFGLASVALAVGLLGASFLPRFTWPLVLAVAIGGSLVLAAAAVRLGRNDPAAPVAIVGGAGMLLVLLDGVLGWPALLMPLLGGSSLEGVRFYGLGNGFAGLLVAGAVLSASRLPPLAGVAFLAIAGFLVGLPGFGANLDGVVLFAAAGVWYGLRVARGSVLMRVASGVAIAAGLSIALLAIHRSADVPTHVTRAVEGGDLVGSFLRRFALNVRNTNAVPATWLIVALLPVTLIVAWRRTGPFGPALRRDPAWRDGIVTLAFASMVGFVANDTIGVAGMGFAFCLAALVYPALAMRWLPSH